jgi:hypothetical protein
MTSTPQRDPATRKKDVLAYLERQGQYWLATASVGGKAHVIAVSAWWNGEDELVFATRGPTITARNLAMNPSATLAGGTPADAIVVSGQVVESRAAEEAPDLAEGFKKALGWDPREEGDDWIMYRFRPTGIKAFRGYEEIGGRDVMIRSRWVV